MASILHVDSGGTYMADEVASICPLLTPSPPTNALVNPLPVSEEASFILPQELVTKLQRVEDDNTEGADSASSNSSTMAEPACTQLLSGHKAYLHKNEESVAEETGGKTQNLQMTFRNPPENYFFMKWNWPVIRKVSAWLFLAGIVAMLAVVIAMVWKLPKTCNPPTHWYQGKLMYEIFPASFSDSDDDGIGDLKGIALRIDYLSSLGVQAVRLNSIFASSQYPENFHNATSLSLIAPQIGKTTDLNQLITALHNENIKLILDVPLWPLVDRLKRRGDFTNGTDEEDPVERALTHWANFGVDGFYLKGLEFLTDEHSFSNNLRSWKRVLGWDKVLIVHNSAIDRATRPESLNALINNVDLVDIRLEMTGGVEKISEQIESALNGTLFTKAGNPWIHWSLGNEDTVRLTNKLPYTNATLGATLLQLMLPGTPCIFYGDEIGLQQISDPHEDRIGLEHLHQLAAMVWDLPGKPFTRKGILPWMHGHPTPVNYAQAELVSKMAGLRATSPAIYLNAVNKEGQNKANAEIKYKENDLLVIQRWYPRRKSYVIVSNLGFVHISADLSTLLYGGQVVVGPTATSKIETLSFKEISLWPGESVVVLLD